MFLNSSFAKKHKNINENNTPVYLFLHDKTKVFYTKLTKNLIRGGGYIAAVF